MKEPEMVSQVVLNEKSARNILVDSKERKVVKRHEVVPQKGKGKSQVEKSSEKVAEKKNVV